MTNEVELSDIEGTLGRLNYPIDRASAASELSDVTLLLADGEVNLGELVGGAAIDEFDSVDDIIASIHNTLPRNAVGEPYQSDGDA